MNGNKKQGFWSKAGVALAIVALVLAGWAVLSTPREPVEPRSNVPCYREQGGEKWIAGSGCEWELQSGATLDSQAGSTVTYGGDVSFDGNITSGDGAITMTDNLLIDGAADAVQLTVQGYSAQTNYLVLLEQSDGTDKLAVSNEGQVAMDAEADADTANYDYMFYLHYAMTGVGTKDRNYGLYVEGARAAGQEIGVGDHDEAGIKVRVDTHAVTTTVGTVLRGIDVEAKVDNPDGTVHNLYGAGFTAKSDTNAGYVDTMIALQSNVQNNAQVTTTLISADFRLMRQAAYEPAAEYVLRVRNSSTTGAGADAGIYITSDYSTTLTTDDMDYAIDMDTAEVTIADLRFHNGGLLEELTDGVLTFSEFLAAKEQTACVVSAGSSITPTGTYQPITSGSPVTTSTSIAIVDGTVIGQLLILINENASDTITVDDGANTRLSGDAVLGNDDTLMLIWDGADWVEIAQANNT